MSTPAAKTRELTSCTIRSPPYAYAHLTSTTHGSTANDIDIDEGLDALQVRAYCTAALRQFLGDTGAAISVDTLLVRGADVWLRVPRQDLGAFAAAMTAYGGMSRGGGATTVMRLQTCGDWLGSLLGRAGESQVWGE
ncbi:hypothetical protein OQA88_6500 [Cercophora sp. LCS_1]